MRTTLTTLLVAACWAACSATFLHAESTSSTVPLDAFFAEDDYRSMQVSPDGRYVAFLTTLGTGKVGIALMHLDTGKIEPLVAAKDENIKFYFWKSGSYLVYGGDLGGNESLSLRSMNIEKRKVVQLADSFRERYAERVAQASIVDSLKFEPNHILIFGNKSTGSYNFGLWKVDIRTGERRSIGYDIQQDTRDLLVDSRGAILARSHLLGKNVVYQIRANATASFRKIAEFPADDDKWHLLSIAADNETLYFVTTEGSETGALRTLNLRTGEIGPELFRAPEGEIDGISLSWDETQLYSVSYTGARTQTHFFSAARANLKKQIDSSLPETVNRIISASSDEKILVIGATSDRDPGTYYLLNLRNPALMVIGKVNQRIDPARMRPMESISFKARDGLTLHGYLTRPANPENKRLPLIINPHGGPFGIRDYWGYNAEIQFLANRGYAVLQINYRGSGGYGYTFQQAGQREWGGKMQDDLTDGVNWAIDQGIADPDRVAIYGASYGGFAAMAGVTFTPELYRCAINYVGATDLSILRRWGNTGGRGTEEYLRDWVGTEKDYLFNNSPINFVERIRVPTLHAYGFNDPRVEIEHWKRLEPKLKQFNKPYEIIIEDNEGHGFYNEKQRLKFYGTMEAFLERNMAPRATATTALAPMNILEMPAKEPPPGTN